MRGNLAIAGLLGCLLLRAGDPAGVVTETRQQLKPVLVELFTSEGCSSCPPADLLLRKLDELQPVAGAQIIVLSEHVDYWNHEGWYDPFSSAEWTIRQKGYELSFKLSDVYTPEMVVDGSVEFLGSDARKAEAAIRDATREPKMPLRIVPESGSQSVAIELDAAGAAQPSHPPEVFVAFAQDHAESEVLRGENHGHTLEHVAVLRKLRKVGKVKASSFHAEVSVAGSAGERLIAFVQEPHTGKVLSAAVYRIPE
jgi:hypothetical protein